MDSSQIKVANAFGFKIEYGNLKSCPKLTYYKKTGEALPNLPADPQNMRKYLDRGFLLEPPKIVPKVAEVMTPQPAVAVSEPAPVKRKKRKSRKSNKEK
jgi:hypothetical protein